MLVARTSLIALAFGVCASAQLGPRVAGTAKAGAGGLALGGATAAILNETNKPLSKAAKVEPDVAERQTAGPPKPESPGGQSELSTAVSPNSSDAPVANAALTPNEHEPATAATPTPYGWKTRTLGSSSWASNPTRVRPVAPRSGPPLRPADGTDGLAGAPANRTVQDRPPATRPRPSRASQQQPSGSGQSVRSDLYVGGSEPVSARAQPSGPTLSSELTQLGLEIGMSIDRATEILGKPHITMRGLFSRDHNEKYVFKKKGGDIVIYGRDGSLVSAYTS